MKWRRAVATLAAVLVVGCGSKTAGLAGSDRAAIKTASADWVAAYNNNDWARLSALFATDAVMSPPGGPSVVGREAIAVWETENETGFRIAFEIEEIDGAGDFAFVRGRSCVFIPLEGGRYGVDPGKFIEIRKRQSDGGRLIERDIFNSDAAPGSDLLDACPFAPTPEAG